MKTAAAHKQIYFWIYLIAAITFITGVSSCNFAGNCVPELPKPVDGRIKTIKGADITPPLVITYGRAESEFTYDNDNKQKTAIVYTENTGVTFSSTYAYTVNVVEKIISTNVGGNSVILGKDRSLLFSGYVSTWVGPLFFYSSFYDAAGHKTKVELAQGEVENYTWDANGNMTEKKVTKDGTTTTTTYTYTGIKDIRVDGLDWFYGKRSTYLPATETTNGITKKYTYGYDKKGRVIWYSFDGKEVSYTYFD